MPHGRPSILVRLPIDVAEPIEAEAKRSGRTFGEVLEAWVYGGELVDCPDPLASRPHAVYRLHDVDGSVLYVGMTFGLRGRLGDHRRMGRTWASVTRENFPDRASARAAERDLIALLSPPWNVNA